MSNFFYQAIRQNAQPALKSGKTFSPCKLWAPVTFSLIKGKNWDRRESEGCTLFTIATTLLQEASVSLIKSSGKPRRPDTDRKAKQVQNWHLPWMVIKHELRIHTFLSEFKTLTSITTLNETRHVEKQLQWYERFLFLLYLNKQPCFYLYNRAFLSRNYRLVVAPWKFEVLKKQISLRGQIH